MERTTRKLLSYVLVLCMLVTGMGQMNVHMAKAADSTTVYFLDNKGWGSIGAYVYNGPGELLGGWPGQTPEAAPELGENWYQIDVPGEAPFNIIFFDTEADSKRAELQIPSESLVYVTGDNQVYASAQEAEQNATTGGDESEETGSTIVYFLNSERWDSIGAYVYGAGEALGPWPGTTPTPSELGEDWYEVEVPANAPFNVIFFNTEADAERAELQIPTADYVYVTGNNQVYSSSLAAELSVGRGDMSLTTTVYFYNSRGWNDVYGYTFAEENGTNITLGAGWPGADAAAAPEVGDNWWKIIVPRIASESPFGVIFSDGMNQTDDVEITDREIVYVTAASGLYASAPEAEAAMANDNEDIGNTDDPNPDLAAYDVTFNEAGAVLPYITYEAEAAQTNGQVLPYSMTYVEDIQSEASGRQAVKLSATGEYVEFTLTEPSNSLVLRYCIPDSADGTGIDATLSLYVDGTEKQDLNLTSRYQWVYGSYPYTNIPSQGSPHRFFDEVRVLFGQTYAAGTTIRLQKDGADTARYYIIDFIEGEEVGTPLAQPENSLSILSYGAVADDGQSDYDALIACIADASASGKTVWIPEGTFDLPVKEPVQTQNVTIQGAGMWYTNLVGPGVSFHYQGTCRFFDFAMTGVSTVRDDSGDLAAFEGGGKSNAVTIQNIWMEHVKVGVWNYNATNLVVQGCRIRNTYADGINLCSGSNGTTVRNNNVRNTGDDGIAIWPWMADCTDNVIAHNTVQMPTLANNIALYGGNGNVVEENHTYDTIYNGAGVCVGSEFATKKEYSGTTTVRNNVLERSGSYHGGYGYGLGAIWFWATTNQMNADFRITDNTIIAPYHTGVVVDCRNSLTGVTINHTTITDGAEAMYVRGNSSGHADVRDMTLNGVKVSSERTDNAAFVVTFDDRETEDKGLPFTDVAESAWYYDSVKGVYELGLMTGMGADGTTFAPGNPMTRAMVVTVLYRMAGSPELAYEEKFPDVSNGHYYSVPVTWVAVNGIVNGFSDGKFKPSGNITREQLVKMLYNYAEMQGLDTSARADLTTYKDGVQISNYAKEPMSWAIANGILSGTGKGELKAKSAATRAEVAKMLLDFYQLLQK